MKVKFKKFNKNAKIPVKAYEDDFCYDVYATSEEEVAPNVWKYGLGFGLQFNYLASGGELYYWMREAGFHLYPRSSVWKTGMVLSNSVGTIDLGYTNEISAVFYHVMPNMPRYKVGDKIGQICIDRTEMLEFEEVEEFKDTERGHKGFGSSGK